MSLDHLKGRKIYGIEETGDKLIMKLEGGLILKVSKDIELTPAEILGRFSPQEARVISVLESHSSLTDLEITSYLDLSIAETHELLEGLVEKGLVVKGSQYAFRLHPNFR